MMGAGMNFAARYSLRRHQAAIWEKTSEPTFVVRHGMTSDGDQQDFDKWLKESFRLMLVNGY
jgi:hypothetical protein